MVNLTTYELTYELRLIAEKRNIEDYKQMSREELLRTFDESERFSKNLSQNGPSELQKYRIFYKMKLSKS